MQFILKINQWCYWKPPCPMRNIYISYSVTDVSYDIEVYVINQNNKSCGGMLFVEMCEMKETQMICTTFCGSARCSHKLPFFMINLGNWNIPRVTSLWPLSLWNRILLCQPSAFSQSVINVNRQVLNCCQWAFTNIILMM